jgi:hypothetical protein
MGADKHAVGFARFGSFSPVGGDQLKLCAPVALNSVQVFGQMVSLWAVASTAGRALTVSNTMALVLQPLLFVPVTV